MIRALLKLACAVCAVAVIAFGVLTLGKAVHSGTHYDHAEKYTAGGATLKDAVKNLDINWVDGSVNIAYHPENTVEISEATKKAISGDDTLRWWLDGETLRIQYAKSGFAPLHGLNKALTVTLPEGLALGDLGIDGVSCDVNVPDLRADNALVDLTSGDLTLRQSGASQRVALSSTSGDISADLSEVGLLDISGTSSAIRATLGNAGEASVSTTSGKIALEADGVQKATIESTSGAIDVTLAAFDDLRIDTTSGNVTAALPSEPGYRADIDTTSGRFDSAVPLAREGSAYTCGDGSARLHIDTTSGNVRLVEFGGK